VTVLLAVIRAIARSLYSLILAFGFCGLWALDFYSLMGAWALRYLTSSEVSQLVGIDICGLSSGLLWASVGFYTRLHGGL
jgi:hypothetical protein